MSKFFSYFLILVTLNAMQKNAAKLQKICYITQIFCDKYPVLRFLDHFQPQFGPFLCHLLQNMQHSSIKYFILANKKIPLHINIISTDIFTYHNNAQPIHFAREYIWIFHVSNMRCNLSYSLCLLHILQKEFQNRIWPHRFERQIP